MNLNAKVDAGENRILESYNIVGLHTSDDSFASSAQLVDGSTIHLSAGWNRIIDRQRLSRCRL